MAITVSPILTEGGDAGASTKDTASVSVTSGVVYGVVVHGNRNTATTGVPTSVTGPGGLVFTLAVGSGPVDTFSNGSIWYGKATSSGSGAIALAWDGSVDGYQVSFFALGGVKTTGTNGADAIRQVKAGTAGTNPCSVTLDSAMLAGNIGLVASVTYRASTTPETATSDWSSEVHDAGSAFAAVYSLCVFVAVSADHTDNTATVTWSAGNAGGYGALAVELVADGTTLTGQTVGVSVAVGQLANTPQVIAGQGVGIGVAAGLVGIAPNTAQIPQWFSEKLIKPRWFDRTLEKAAWFSRYYADSGDAPTGLTGQGLGITVSRGSLGVTGALTLTGQAVSIATAVGSVFVPPDSIVGRALSIAAANGNLGPSGAYTLAGQTLAIAGAAGAPGSATGIGPAGQFLGLALSAGTLGATDSLGLAGQGAAVAAAAGALAPTSPGALTGQGVSIAATAGTLGAVTAYVFTGQALGILAVAGAVTPPGTLAGQGANIAAAAGTIGISSALGVTGQFVGVATAHGTLGPQDAQTLTGRAAAITVAAGSLATPGGGTLTGFGLGIAATHGVLGPLGAYALGGATATITVAIGSLATPSGGALTGFGLGVATTHGALGTSAAVVPLGQFVGIALAAGGVGLPGEAITRTPTGQALGIVTQAAWLTWVEYGPPVDAALRARHIADNEAILQFAAANVWRWHLPAGAELPKGFPYLSQLNAAGYTMPRHVKAATAEELDAAGFTARQITAILTAAEKL